MAKSFRQFVTESNQRPCDIFEPVAGQWYYAVAFRGDDDFDDEYERDAYDWRKEADVAGPFSSEDAAIEHLNQHHSNPGGWNSYDQAWLKSHGGAGQFKKLVARAKPAERPYRYNPYTGR
jgi:hypothetical protein